MSKWLLTADWQSSFQTLDVCMQAHAQEMFLAKRYKAAGIFDLGDLKHVYNPIEARVLEFQVDRWRHIRRYFKTLLLMGNHDRIGQYDDTRNWFGAFKGMKLNAVTRPKIVKFDTVIFACLPYMHNKKAYKKAAAKLWEEAKSYGRKIRKILLFHCDVAGSDFGLGMRSTSDVTGKDLLFHKWSFCFGGHIHKRQYLARNAMYVGNPFCCDWGERDQDKGFILYDDETNNVQVLRSNIPGWYSYQYLHDNKIKKVANGARIQVPVICKLKEDYYAAVTKKQDEVLAKYPNAKVYTKTEFITTDKSSPLIEATGTDLDKIKSFVSHKAPDTLEQKQVVKYLESVLKKVSAVTRSQEGIRFKNIKARKVLSFEKLDFSFENQGIVLIVGKNKDWPKHSNGSGKTNFLSLLPIALNGETLKKQKHDDWLNEHLEGKGYVDLNIEDTNENTFKVHRSRNPDATQFFINKRDESEDKQVKTQELINNVLGFTLPTLKSSVYIDNSLPKAFIEGTPSDRKDLISKFQNLERFKLARDIVAKHVRRSEGEIERLQDEEHDAKDLVASAKKEIKIAKSDIAASVNELKVTVIKAKERFKKYQAKRDKYFTSHLSSLAKKQAVYKVLDANDIETAKEIYPVTDEMDKQKRELEKLKRFKWKICPKCHQHVSSERRNQMRDEHITECNLLQERFQRLHKEQQKYIVKKKELQEKISKIKLAMNSYSMQTDQAEQHLDSCYRMYKRHKETTEKRSEVIKLLKAKLKKARTKLRHTRDAIAQEITDKELLIFGMDAFSKDGIPLYLNSLACPLLNKLAEEYSKMFIDGEIQVVFRLNGGEIEPIVLNAHGSKKITGQSAGEMAWAGFISALALQGLAPKTNLLALDEPGFGLDGESATQFAKKLRLLKERFETILVVTHNETIASMLEADRTLVIEKEHKISTLK